MLYYKKLEPGSRSFPLQAWEISMQKWLKAGLVLFLGGIASGILDYWLLEGAFLGVSLPRQVAHKLMYMGLGLIVYLVWKRNPGRKSGGPVVGFDRIGFAKPPGRGGP